MSDQPVCWAKRAKRSQEPCWGKLTGEGGQDAGGIDVGDYLTVEGEIVGPVTEVTRDWLWYACEGHRRSGAARRYTPKPVVIALAELADGC